MPKIAAIQLCSQNRLDDNKTCIENAIAHAKTHGADLVVLPENACLMGGKDRQCWLAAQFDALICWYQNLAKTHQIAIIAGTLPCFYDFDSGGQNIGSIHCGGAMPTSTKLPYQSTFAIDQHGNIVARYDKIHLFYANVGDAIGCYDERKTFLAGKRPVCADFVLDGQNIRIGLMICFDVRFAHLARHYRSMGADILAIPAAFTHATGQKHWHTLLKARALDAQCFTIGAAQGGWHNRRRTFGHSLMVDADGQVLQDTHTSNTNAAFLCLLSEFNKSAQDALRQKQPFFELIQDL